MRVTRPAGHEVGVELLKRCCPEMSKKHFDVTSQISRREMLRWARLLPIANTLALLSGCSQPSLGGGAPIESSKDVPKRGKRHQWLVLEALKRGYVRKESLDQHNKLDEHHKRVAHLLEIQETITQPGKSTAAQSATLSDAKFADDINEELIAISKEERSTPTEKLAAAESASAKPVSSTPGKGGAGAQTNSNTSASARLTYDSLRQGYLDLLKTSVIAPSHAADIESVSERICSDKRRSVYETVSKATSVPWFFVGVIHYMECGLNFRAHLHNGDNLAKKTIDVPQNRPPIWDEAQEWSTSAVDAIRFDGFEKVTNWTFSRIMYSLEAYNGFGCRKKNINTPYLWSFTNHYTSGKFISDGTWDQNAVSKQCGAVSILKTMADKKLIDLQAS